MMSKFTRSWALKGNDRHAPGPQPTNTTPVALTGSLNVDGRGGGLPPSADRPTYGQQQNGAGGQQPSKPSTAPTASSMASHGVDQIYRAGEQLLTNTAPKAGATANPSSYGGNGSYPSATPGPYDNQQFMTKHTDNEREVKGHDNNQMIRSPSMSTQSQRDKVLQRSKTEERISAPADPPATGSPQYSTPQDVEPQPKESKTRDDKAQGGTTAEVQRGLERMVAIVNKQASSRIENHPSYGTPLTAPSSEIQDRKSPTRSPPKTNMQQVSQPVTEKKGGCCSIL